MTKYNGFQTQGVNFWTTQKRPLSFQSSPREMQILTHFSSQCSEWLLNIEYCCYTCKKSTHLKGHALRNFRSTWHSCFFWAQINQSVSGTTTGGVSVLRIMLSFIPGTSLIRGAQNNLRAEVTVIEDCFRTGKCDI